MLVIVCNRDIYTDLCSGGYGRTCFPGVRLGCVEAFYIANFIQPVTYM